jgi:hypothetical protein
MGHEDEKHRVKIATDTTKTAHEVANKDKMAAHGMEMSAQMTKAKAKASEIKAKQKPVAKKPAKKA